MKKILSVLVILCGALVYPVKSLAQDEQTELLVASANFTPYFVYDNPNTLGLFNDIFNAALMQAGYTRIAFKPLGNEAIKRNFLIGKAEVALNWGGVFPEGFYPSKYRLKFVNRVIIKKNGALAEVTALADIKDYKVVSFVNATRVFGEQYNKAMKNNAYIEYEDQEITNRLFISERFDAKVGDWLMFLWALGVTSAQQQAMPYLALDLLDYQGSGILFKDSEVRDKVDLQITAMLLSGQIEELVQNWFKQMGIVPYKHQFISLEQNQ